MKLERARETALASGQERERESLHAAMVGWPILAQRKHYFLVDESSQVGVASPKNMPLHVLSNRFDNLL